MLTWPDGTHRGLWAAHANVALWDPHTDVGGSVVVWAPHVSMVVDVAVWAPFILENYVD